MSTIILLRIVYCSQVFWEKRFGGCFLLVMRRREHRKNEMSMLLAPPAKYQNRFRRRSTIAA